MLWSTTSWFVFIFEKSSKIISLVDMIQMVVNTKKIILDTRGHSMVKKSLAKKYSQVWDRIKQSCTFAWKWVRTGGDSPSHISHPCSIFLLWKSYCTPRFWHKLTQFRSKIFRYVHLFSALHYVITVLIFLLYVVLYLLPSCSHPMMT